MGVVLVEEEVGTDRDAASSRSITHGGSGKHWKQIIIIIQSRFHHYSQTTVHMYLIPTALEVQSFHNSTHENHSTTHTPAHTHTHKAYLIHKAFSELEL